MSEPVKVKDSIPAVTEELSLFALPPTETGIERRYYVDYRPVSQLVDDCSPIEFNFMGVRDYLDLKKTELHVRAKIVNASGGDVVKTDYVAPANLLLHSMFEKVDLTIQDTLMTHAMGGYPYASYFRTLKCLGADNKHLEAAGFSMDWGDMEATGIMPKVDPNDATEKRKMNLGASERGKWFLDGNTFAMQGPLLADVCDLYRLIPGNTKVAVKLYRSRPEFVLSAPLNPTGGYKIILEEIYLRVAYAKPSSGAVVGIDNALENKHKAAFPFTRSEVRTFNIPQNYQDIYLDNIFQGIVPSLVLVGLLDSRAKNGDYSKNCFNFQPYDVREYGMSVNGTYVPSLPVKVDFSNGQNYVAAYKDFMSCLKGKADDVGIDLKRYKDGYTIFAFNLEGALGKSDPDDMFNLKKFGSCRLEMRFGTQLPHTVSMVVYAEYPSMFTMDKNRSVKLH